MSILLPTYYVYGSTSGINKLMFDEQDKISSGSVMTYGYGYGYGPPVKAYNIVDCRLYGCQ